MKQHTRLGAIFALVLLIVVVGPTAWRWALGPDIVMPNIRNVTPQLDASVEKLVHLPNVAIAGVAIADVVQNTRQPLVSHFRDKAIRGQIAQYIALHTDIQPVFTPNGPNTLGILDVVNGGNNCAPFTTTIMYSMMPELGATLKTACLFGMPFIDPRYRHYVLIFFTTEVTLADMGPYEEAIDKVKQAMYLSWISKWSDMTPAELLEKITW